MLGFNMFPATQVAAAHDNKGAVRLLLEKGFVLYSNPDLGIIEATIRVDPKARGDNGKTAMEVATEYMSNIDRGVSEEVLNFLCGPNRDKAPEDV